jgi:tetratricopeptide (TPR) repeat protein
MVVDRPLLGFGPDNYRILNVRYWTPYEHEYFARDRTLNEHPHNDFLFAAISAGIPGLLLFVAILIRAFAAGLSVYLNERDADLRRFGLTCAALAILFAIDGMFGFNLVAPASGALLFLVLGAFDGVYTADATPRTVPAWQSHVAVTLCVLLASACAALGTAVFASQVYLARGQGAMYWKDYRAAGEQFKRAAILTPWDWMPNYYAAKAHAAQGDLTGALNLTMASLKRNPYYVPALLDAAFTEFNLATSEPVTSSPDVLEAARAFARQAQTLCPPIPEADDVLGRAAFLEAERVRATGGHESEGYERLIQESIDRFSLAIVNGAENVDELSKLKRQAQALLPAK